MAASREARRCGGKETGSEQGEGRQRGQGGMRCKATPEPSAHGSVLAAAPARNAWAHTCARACFAGCRVPGGRKGGRLRFRCSALSSGGAQSLKEGWRGRAGAGCGRQQEVSAGAALRLPLPLKQKRRRQEWEAGGSPRGEELVRELCSPAVTAGQLRWDGGAPCPQPRGCASCTEPCRAVPNHPPSHSSCRCFPTRCPVLQRCPAPCPALLPHLPKSR